LKQNKIWRKSAWSFACFGVRVFLPQDTDNTKQSNKTQEPGCARNGKFSSSCPDLGLTIPFSRELAVMAAILDVNPVIAELAWQDIVEGRSHQTGAPGLAAMAVVKAAVLQKVLGASYERLAFHLADSASCRRFLGLGPFDAAPSASALQDNVSRLRPRTWESINRVLIKWAQEAGIENGRKMRFDSTAVEADIHHPTDSSLLGDLVRVICRHQKGRAAQVHDLPGPTAGGQKAGPWLLHQMGYKIFIAYRPRRFITEIPAVIAISCILCIVIQFTVFGQSAV
jgi:hypothetical protein